MNRQEALELLKQAPCDNKISKVNINFTRAEMVEILRKGFEAMSREKLSELDVKHVWQVVKDQRRPRYEHERR